jgi:hypothetical protein
LLKYFKTHIFRRHELVVREEVEDGEDGVVSDALGRDSNARPRVGQTLAGQLAALVERGATFKQDQRRFNVGFLKSSNNYIVYVFTISVIVRLMGSN